MNPTDAEIVENWRKLMAEVRTNSAGSTALKSCALLLQNTANAMAEKNRRIVALEQVGRALLEACSLLIFGRNDPDYHDCLEAAEEAMRAAKDAGL
jgi:hypothetical protein